MPRKFFLLIVFLCCLIAEAALGQVSEPILVGYGRDPKWSPGETSISLIRNDSLFVTRLDSTKDTRFIHFGPILKYEWIDDSTLAAQERYDIPVKNGRIFVEKIVKLSVAGQVFEVAKDSFHTSSGESRRLSLGMFPNGSVGYFDNEAPEGKVVNLTPRLSRGSNSDSTRSVLFVDTSPPSWGKVWLYYGDRHNGREITRSANTFSLPRLAPSCDKFSCMNHRAEIIVFDTLGNILANLGRGDMQSWDSRGQYITFCNTKYSHYDLKSGDIFVVKYDGTERRQLTSTPDIIEYEPSFSPSSRYIMYTDYGNDALYVLRVE